jgi:Zn-dependent protease
MKWSWRIGRLLGIDVYMHATFLILLVWLGVSYYLPRQRMADVINGLTLIIALFGIVILHEMGHALTARRFGVRTRDITLLPIGASRAWNECLMIPSRNFWWPWRGQRLTSLWLDFCCS